MHDSPMVGRSEAHAEEDSGAAPSGGTLRIGGCAVPQEVDRGLGVREQTIEVDDRLIAEASCETSWCVVQFGWFFYVMFRNHCLAHGTTRELALERARALF